MEQRLLTAHPPRASRAGDQPGPVTCCPARWYVLLISGPVPAAPYHPGSVGATSPEKTRFFSAGLSLSTENLGHFPSSVFDTIYSPRASRVVPTISQHSLPCCSRTPQASIVSPARACPL
jgi:hypothetical protein